jgi:phage gp46-like protein
MADLRLAFDPLTLQADLVFASATLATADDLETAVMVALFTDARAGDDDAVPGDPADRRGWWGDALPISIMGRELPADRLGSRLWLLERAKQLPETLVLARQYAREALQVFIEGGIAASIEVDAGFPRAGWLLLHVGFVMPDGSRRQFGPWEANWQAQSLRRAASYGGA